MEIKNRYFSLLFQEKMYICIMKKEYERYSHAKVHIRYHMIFSTKYRRNIFEGIEQDVIDVFHNIASRCSFKIIKIGIDKNHVHLLVKSCPSLSILQIVRRLKQLSTNELWEKQSEHLQKYYWKKKILWSKGYFCSTVGEASEETIEKYIENKG